MPDRVRSQVASAKGSTLRATLDYVRSEHGEDSVDRVLARLGDERREQVEGAASTQEVPFDLLLALWSAVDTELANVDANWPERSGAHSIKLTGTQLYGGILRKSTPTEFLRQGVSLFQLYYSPGNMEVVEEEANRAVLRLIGFSAASSFFCRRQTGGLRGALAVAGGASPQTAHVRCVSEGDAFCEWELRWG